MGVVPAAAQALAVLQYLGAQAQPTRYVGAYLPRRHRPNPAAERLLAALRTHALVKPPDPDRTPVTGEDS